MVIAYGAMNGRIHVFYYYLFVWMCECILFYLNATSHFNRWYG